MAITLTGNAGANTLCGGDGDDAFVGSNSNDIIFGGNSLVNNFTGTNNTIVNDGSTENSIDWNPG